MVLEEDFFCKGTIKQVMTQQELNKQSSYSMKNVYKKLIEDHLKVNWDFAVWNTLNLPKHMFIIWLAVQQRNYRLQLN